MFRLVLDRHILPYGESVVNKSVMNIVFIGAMVATVVIVDVLFFRHRFWERLMSNVGIVLIYVAFYLAFLKNR